MKFLKRLLTLILVLILAAVAVIYYLSSSHVDISAYDSWTVPASEPAPPGKVQVRFAGVATLAITDGETTLMTDGFFSRPGDFQLLFDKIEPDMAGITYGLEKLKVDKLAAIMTVHSHYDHAMDTPEVAKRTGAIMIGSESTANIGRGWGLPEGQIKVIKSGEPMTFGAFTVTAIKSKHFAFPDGFIARRIAAGPQEITSPVKPPIGAFDYREGGHYAYVISHPSGTLLIQGSAGYVNDSLKGIDADVVMLGIGGLGSQNDDYGARYFAETVDMTAPKLVFAIHADDLAGPLDQPFRGPSLLVDKLLGSTIPSYEMFKREMEKRPTIKYGMLPRWAPVTLFE